MDGCIHTLTGYRGVAPGEGDALGYPSLARSGRVPERWPHRDGLEHDRRALANTLIQSTLNGIEAYLLDILQRIVSGRTRSHELHALLAWNWRLSGAVPAT